MQRHTMTKIVHQSLETVSKNILRGGGGGLNQFYVAATLALSSAVVFQFLWDHWAHSGTFENGVQLMYTLEGVSSFANFITAYEVSQ